MGAIGTAKLRGYMVLIGKDLRSVYSTAEQLNCRIRVEASPRVILEQNEHRTCFRKGDSLALGVTVLDASLPAHVAKSAYSAPCFDRVLFM
jgi:hypothetical protein